MNLDRPWRRAMLLAALAMSAPAGSATPPALPSAPNVVEISPHLVTSGQPSAQALAALRAQGFDAVIYLAPLTVSDAVRDEPLILGRQGIVFADIPIDFGKPTEQDYETFAALLKALSDRRVLVHCQVNMRASSMVFLYRVVERHEDPRAAYEAVTGVWSPDGPWKQLMQDVLRKHGVNFELY